MHLRLLAAACTLLAAAGLAHASETVRIGWLRAPNDLTLAKAHGSLEMALATKGADVEWAGPFPAAAPAFEALNAGSVDVTAGSSTAAVAGLAAGVPLMVFAYQPMSAAAEGILVAGDAPIAAINDLAGRKVAVNRGGTGEYLLVRALANAGVDVGTVGRVYLSPADSGAALAEGHVDAWATWDPFVTLATRTAGARVLADGDAIGSDNAVVLVASRSFATLHRELLDTVYDVVAAENAWAVAHPTDAGAIWVREMGLSPDLADAIGAASAVPTRAVTDTDVAEIGRVADWYVENGIVASRPDVAAGTIGLR